MAKEVLIADDHPLLAEGIASLIRPYYDVVGVCSNGRELLELAPRLKPAVITLDIGMPEMNGLEAATRLQVLIPQTRLICVTQQLDMEYLLAAFRAGITGFVSKQSVSGELLEALRDVLLGRPYITLALRERFEELSLVSPNKLKAETPMLTPRQREVLQLIAEGKATKEIAVALNVSAKTVEFHRGSIASILGLRTVADLTRYALKHGITHT